MKGGGGREGEDEKRHGLMYVVIQTSGCIIKIHWIIITDNEQTAAIFLFQLLVGCQLKWQTNAWKHVSAS